MNLTSPSLSELADRFESVMPPLAQTLIRDFVRPLISSGVGFVLAFANTQGPIVYTVLNELVTNLPNANISSVLGGVIPTIFDLFT